MDIRWPLAVAIGASSLLWQGAVQAQEPVTAPEPPIVDEDELEPSVTIVPGETQTTTEYRLNGRLYMVKIQPAAGPAYYLVDNDGDGELETQLDGQTEPLAVPRWVLIKW